MRKERKELCGLFHKENLMSTFFFLDMCLETGRGMRFVSLGNKIGYLPIKNILDSLAN